MMVPKKKTKAARGEPSSLSLSLLGPKTASKPRKEAEGTENADGGQKEGREAVVAAGAGAGAAGRSTPTPPSPSQRRRIHL